MRGGGAGAPGAPTPPLVWGGAPPPPPPPQRRYKNSPFLFILPTEKGSREHIYMYECAYVQVTSMIKYANELMADWEGYPLHECVFHNDIRKLSQLLRVNDVALKDMHGIFIFLCVISLDENILFSN